jgi:lipopolysaccharide/colanic/teichoic acid biosynthesis glycosyltransferase
MGDFSNSVPVKLSVIALVNCDFEVAKMLSNCYLKDAKLLAFKNGIDLFDHWNQNDWNVLAVITQSEVMSPSGVSLLEILKNKKKIHIPFIIICKHWNEKILKIALQAGVAEIFQTPFKIDNFEMRFNFIIDNWDEIKKSQKIKDTEAVEYKTPIVKRLFDIIVSGTLLIILAPIFIMVGFFVRLESKGPVFYYSFRVGRGYHIFKFYKFRSMFLDADKKLKDIKHLNQYTKNKRNNHEIIGDTFCEFLCEDCKTMGVECQFPIYSDTVQMCEKEYMEQKIHNRDSTFIKIKDDPRMTKVGKFIRRSSIDELPQLWNVLIGDMSIVGNRPLPLYEAEKLTTDKYALRFLAPAGITGLWQVEKRGTGKMHENERLLLDNIYAKNNSFLNDIILILRTIPALFQKENV